MNRNFLKQAQQLQAKLAKAQEELETQTVEASVGGGVVKVVATGKQTIESIAIDPSAVDPNDVEILQDLMLAAVNDALAQSDINEEKLEPIIQRHKTFFDFLI